MLLLYEHALQAVWGSRAPALLAALRAARRPCALVNSHCLPGDAPGAGTGEDEPVASGVPVPGLSGCVVPRRAGALFRPPARGGSPSSPSGGPLLDYYAMDAASVACARALPVRAGQRVLDMCAAPGGKTLVLADMVGPGGTVVANDPSAARRARLRRVVADYLPDPERVTVSGVPGSVFGPTRPRAFDAVLVDAPCTGDRFLLAEPAELALWTPARASALADRQQKLLQSAVHTVCAGGFVLYVTCSIWPVENDGVVQRLLDKAKRKGWRLRCVRPTHDPPFGEPTALGWQMLPDACDGWGPNYFSLLHVEPEAADEGKDRPRERRRF
jgi:hypothetical protein